MKKAVIITGIYAQDSEWIFPYYRLKEAGYEVRIATIDGKETTGVYGIKIPVDTSIRDLRVEDFDVLILPGGARAMEYIRQNEDVLRFIRDFDAAGKVIGCICHGTQLLISARVVQGRNISGYYSIKDDIANAGGKYVDAPAVVDRNIVTSPHYRYLGEWMREIMKLLPQ